MRSQLFVFGVVAVLSSSFSQVQAASGASPVAPLTTSSDPVAPKSPVILKTGVPFAGAKLEARSGSKASGTVTFTKEREGIRVNAKVSGLAAGTHGFHIHEKGDCSAPDASSAGGHFNPGGSEHGDPKMKNRHAGDMGNIEIKKDGTGSLMLKVSDPKNFSAWAEIGGKAVILHEKADDLKTQPTGNAGARIACGLIELSPATTH